MDSPNCHSANSSNNSSTNSTTSNGLIYYQTHNHFRHPSPRTPAAPIPALDIIRSETNSTYQTTFVQTDISNFKQVVQMLTGSIEPTTPASGPARQEIAPVRNFSIPPINPGLKASLSASKLYERRNSLKNSRLSTLPSGSGHPIVSSGSPRPEVLSPSLLDFPSLTLSPVTPLLPDPFNRSPPAGMNNNNNNNNASLNLEAEEKAIAGKRFYLHPSPRTTPREFELPKLLPLFPVTSPSIAGSDN